MFGFPGSTAVKRIIAKDSLFGRIGTLPEVTAAQKTAFNNEIKQVAITNVVGPKTLAVAPGSRVPGFYVANVVLKQKNFSLKNVETLLHRIGQKNILLALCVGESARFALKYDDYVVVSKDWVSAGEYGFALDGLDLDAIWNGIVKQVAGEPWNDSLNVADNLDIHKRVEKLQKEIVSLEKKARAEIQPARKLEFFNQLKTKIAELADATTQLTSLRAKGEAIHPDQ